MEPIPKSHPAVTAAGIVAIAFGALGVLAAILVEVSMMFVSRIASEDKAAQLPEAVRAMTSIVWLFFLALAIFGIFVGAYILRRRNWARITILIWGGLMAFFSAISLVATFLVLTYMPPTIPNASEVAPVMAVMKWVMTLFYAIPLGVGIWWLILFTRKAVVEEFNPLAARLHPGKTLDASGFPQEPPETPSYVPGGSTCPLLVIIIAGLSIFGGAYMLMMFLIPHSMISLLPIFFFGHAFYGALPQLILALLGIVNIVCGVGILRLKPWALDPLIWCQALFMISGIVTLLNPQFIPTMMAAMPKMMSSYPGVPATPFPFSDSFFKYVMVFSYLFGGVLMAILIFYRKRFLEAARAKHSLAG